MISVKSEKEICIMKKGGEGLRSVMERIGKEVRVGVSTYDLDKLAEKLVFDFGGEPAFKGYGDPQNPFPATICASINDEIVHGIPRKETVLKEGDLLKVDIGMYFEGYFTDMARSFIVGKALKETVRIKEVVEKSFWKGARALKGGVMLSDYSKAVQKYVESEGFSIVRTLVGHGIGKDLHEDPQIPNFFDTSFRDFEIKEGMVFALEPMINAGTSETKIGEDDWVFKTKDGKLSAHYENTIAVTKDGIDVLTA